jgi:hypothetical protein
MVLSKIRSVSSKANRVKGYGKKIEKKSANFNFAVILYCAVFALILSLSILLNFLPTLTAASKYAFTFFLSVLMGIIHLKMMYNKIEWAQKETYFKEFALTICIPFIAGLISVLLVHYLLTPGYGGVAIFISIAYLSFIIPYLWSKTYRFALLIPERIFTYWSYPQHAIEPSSDWQRDKFVYANLKFSKSLEDQAESTVKVRLPLDAKFGELIYLFVEDYNERRNPEFPIIDLHKPDGSLKWHFSAKTRFGSRPIDPDQTISANKLKDEQEIHFARVLIS